jgi:hypothetical protein
MVYKNRDLVLDQHQIQKIASVFRVQGPLVLLQVGIQHLV